MLVFPPGGFEVAGDTWRVLRPRWPIRCARSVSLARRTPRRWCTKTIHYGRRQPRPAWIGVNPTNGKCQLIWLIDPVYADSRADSANIRLMKVVTTMLGEHLGGDAAFAHRLSRSPFYGGDDPTAYRWHVQHHRVDRLSHLRDELRTMTGQPAPQTTPAAQNFSSGRELIDAVVARREQAQHTVNSSTPGRRPAVRRGSRRRPHRRGESPVDHPNPSCPRRNRLPARASDRVQAPGGRPEDD